MASFGPDETRRAAGADSEARDLAARLQEELAPHLGPLELWLLAGLALIWLGVSAMIVLGR